MYIFKSVLLFQPTKLLGSDKLSSQKLGYSGQLAFVLSLDLYV